MSKLTKGSKKIAAKATKSGKAKPAKATTAKATKSAQSKAAAPARERISALLPRVQAELASESGTKVEALREQFGICRKSVRKLLAQAGAVRDDKGIYRAA